MLQADVVGRRLTRTLSAGYFDGSATGLWEGTNGIRLGIEPQYGPSRVHDRLGMTLIGATPWIVNFNVLVKDIDLPQGAPKRIQCLQQSCLLSSQ